MQIATTNGFLNSVVSMLPSTTSFIAILAAFVSSCDTDTDLSSQGINAKQVKR